MYACGNMGNRPIISGRERKHTCYVYSSVRNIGHLHMRLAIVVYAYPIQKVWVCRKDQYKKFKGSICLSTMFLSVGRMRI